MRLRSPYGALLVLDANGTPVPGNTSNINQQITYTGQRLDPETSNYYFKNRYYDPAQGNFISRDPLGYTDGMNLYAAYFALRFAMDMLGQYEYILVAGTPGAGQYNVGEQFKNSAEWRKSEIESRSTFDPSVDKVTILTVGDNPDEKPGIVNGNTDLFEYITKDRDGNNKIAGLEFFSHASMNGITLSMTSEIPEGPDHKR